MLDVKMRLACNKLLDGLEADGAIEVSVELLKHTPQRFKFARYLKTCVMETHSTLTTFGSSR